MIGRTVTKKTSLSAGSTSAIASRRFRIFQNKQGSPPFVKETGRFGLAAGDKRGVEDACQKAAERLNALRKGKRVLCLGTGEFMYLPMKIASLMGEHVFYHSTTRSPIHPSGEEGYAVKNGFGFPNPENETVKHFIYNLPKRGYDEAFVFIEKSVSARSFFADASYFQRSAN